MGEDADILSDSNEQRDPLPPVVMEPIRDRLSVVDNSTSHVEEVV